MHLKQASFLSRQWGDPQDVDATVIEAEKRDAQWTYKKVKGYQPILGFIKENSLCLAYESREGNVPGSPRIHKSVAMILCGK